MRGNATVFGVNFADGRIKGYDLTDARRPAGACTASSSRCVRGNPAYGKNDFHDNGDGTITDRATGLMWSKADSGKGMNWQDALAWVQKKNAEKYLGHDDWRLPNAKELQSIVDYTRSPRHDPLAGHRPGLHCTTTTTGRRPTIPSTGPARPTLGRTARTGSARPRGRLRRLRPRAMGWTAGPAGRRRLRTCSTSTAPARSAAIPRAATPPTFPHGRGPQGDVVRINNFVRSCAAETLYPLVDTKQSIRDDASAPLPARPPVERSSARTRSSPAPSRATPGAPTASPSMTRSRD